jgi:hypothetical protein
MGFGQQLNIHIRNSKDPERGGRLTQERFAEYLRRHEAVVVSRSTVNGWVHSASAKIKPEERHVLLAVISVLYECGGLETEEEANALLNIGGFKNLDPGEIQKIIPDWDRKSSLQERMALPLIEANSLYALGNSRLSDLVENFSGREFVFEAIQKFMNRSAGGYFLLKADPGVGKSAILAQFVLRTQVIAHFILRADGSNHASQFLEHVCLQLIDRYNLPVDDLPPDAFQNGLFLKRLIEDAAGYSTPAEPLVIAIDGLDELDTHSWQTHGNILFLPPVLPENTYVVMSSRSANFSFSPTSDYTIFDLMDHSGESRADVESYLEKATKEEGIKKWIHKKALTKKAFVEELAAKSENNFMFLRFVLADIRRGLFDDFSMSQLPVGLQHYYDIHWRLMGMTASPLPASRIQIIYIICEIGKLVSRDMIADLAGYSPLQVQQVLDDWHQFIPPVEEEDQVRYRFYHNSFRDFLHRKEVVRASGLSLEGVNARISSVMLDEWDRFKDDA